MHAGHSNQGKSKSAAFKVFVEATFDAPVLAMGSIAQPRQSLVVPAPQSRQIQGSGTLESLDAAAPVRLDLLPHVHRVHLLSMQCTACRLCMIASSGERCLNREPPPSSTKRRSAHHSVTIRYEFRLIVTAPWAVLCCWLQWQDFNTKQQRDKENLMKKEKSITKRAGRV